MMKNKKSEITAASIWAEYEKGKAFLNKKCIQSKTKVCFDFIEGKQWNGLNVKGDTPPSLNFLFSNMKQTTALVGQNLMTIVFSPVLLDKTSGDERELYLKTCDNLTALAAIEWESQKMDYACWEAIQEAYVCGDSFVYFYFENGRINREFIENTDILLSDENERDIQKNKYILIVQRKNVGDVRAKAEKSGVKRFIEPDGRYDRTTGKIEVDGADKVTVITRLFRDERNRVCFAESTRDTLVTPPTVIEADGAALEYYPICHYCWKRERGYARGLGEIYDKIPNQVSVNKNLYRYEQAVKNNAFPVRVVNRTFISEDNVERLSTPGATIEVDSTSEPVKNVIDTLPANTISPYAKAFHEDLIYHTKQLSGAGDNLENVNPENASGVAIIAAREAKTINVNSQVAAFKQFIEDIAKVWYDFWLVYYPDGLEVPVKNEAGENVLNKLTQEQLRRFKITVKIDVSAKDPFSKSMQEQNLLQLLGSGQITLEEFVGMLDADSNFPKAKLEAALEKRNDQSERQKDLLIEKYETALKRIGGKLGEAESEPNPIDELR